LSTNHSRSKPPSDPSSRPSSHEHAIDTSTPVADAVSELRRGRGVVLLPEKDGAHAALAIAAEQISDARLDQVADWPLPPALLALTGRRAAVLHIPPSGAPAVLLEISDLGADVIRSLADPTTDLAHPLRGPFARPRTPPPVPAKVALELCRLAGLLPAALIVPISDAAQATAWAEAHELACVNVAAITEWERDQARRIAPIVSARVPLAGAERTHVIAFRARDGGPEHLAIVIGTPSPDISAPERPALVRLNSECFTGDLLASLRCDCGEQLRGAVSAIATAGGGVILYLAQEGRGIGLINKLRAYQLQDQGFDTFEANERLGFAPDERLFDVAAAMLRHLGLTRIRLLTNNPDKVAALTATGIDVAQRVPHEFPANSHNQAYLAAKARRSGYTPPIPDDEDDETQSPGGDGAR